MEDGLTQKRGQFIGGGVGQFCGSNIYCGMSRAIKYHGLRFDFSHNGEQRFERQVISRLNRTPLFHYKRRNRSYFAVADNARVYLFYGSDERRGASSKDLISDIEFREINGTLDERYAHGGGELKYGFSVDTFENIGGRRLA